MKTFKKNFGIIAMVVITVGLNACVSMSPAPEDEETLALRNTLFNATWNKETLANQPSLDGCERLLYGEEATFISGAATDIEKDDGREIRYTVNGVDYMQKRIYMAPDTWYALTAPEMPGVLYYYYRAGGGALSVWSVYRKML
jgi:hypothetical protein